MEPQGELSSDETPRSGWQFLGQIELSADLNADTIHTWLVELLTPLNLHSGLVNQLLNSAQDAAIRALHSNTGMSFEHIHLSVFVPSEFTALGRIWGFFRIEKIDGTESIEDRPNHAVEFYLYQEE
jgi:hypothetical protein